MGEALQRTNDSQQERVSNGLPEQIVKRYWTAHLCMHIVELIDHPVPLQVAQDSLGHV